MDLKTLDAKYKVSSEDLFFGVDPTEFRPTSDIQPSQGLERIIGHRDYIQPFQEALGSSRAGDNIAVIAPDGYGKRLFVDMCIADYRARASSGNIDQIAYYNFSNPNRPKVAQVSAGTARSLVKDLDTLVNDISEGIMAYESLVMHQEKISKVVEAKIALFKKEHPGEDIPAGLKAEYDSMKAILGLGSKYSDKEEKLKAEIEGGYLKRIEEFGAEVSKELAMVGYELKRDHLGCGTTPLGKIGFGVFKEGKYLKDNRPSIYTQFYDEVGRLKDECKERVGDLHKISLVHKYVSGMEFRYRNEPGVLAMLSDFKGSMAEDIGQFMPKKSLIGPTKDTKSLARYKVTVLQDNAESKGKVPYVRAEGSSIMEFRGSEDLYGWDKREHQKVIPGKLVQASGGPDGRKGILVVENGDTLLMHPMMTTYIFNALSTGKVRPLSMKGEIDCEEALANVRVVMPLSNAYAEHYLAHPANAHMASMFQRVLVLPVYMENTLGNRREIARHFRDEIDANKLKHATPSAIAKVIEYQMSHLGKNKLSLELDDLVDIYTRANTKASEDGSEMIDSMHVQSAVLGRVQERNMRERRVRDYMVQHYFPQEKEVGAVGGISVYTMGHMFGNPFRIVVQAVPNKGDGLRMMDIDRSSNMAGDMAVKGMLQVEALLKRRYHTPKTPLNYDLHCSKSQEFGTFDGPSASTANAVACVSAIGKIPVYPNVFFTGAIDPSTGESLPIGGLNYKVMGVIDTAFNAGMKDTIVAFPKRNLEHLQLFFDKYREAVDEGKVRVYSYGNLDEALEIATREDAKAVDAKVKSRMKMDKPESPNLKSYLETILKKVLAPK